MKHKITIIAAVALTLVWATLRPPGGTTLAEPEREEAGGRETGALAPFLGPVKPELELEIEQLMASISERYPMSDESEQELVGRMAAFETDRLTLEEALEFKKYIANLGLRAVPSLASMCLHPIPQIRRNAVRGLASLLRPREHFDEEYKQTEAAVLPLLLRSLLDVDPGLRTQSLMQVRWLVVSRWPDPEPRALTALVVTAINDPDENVRLMALLSLKHLGLPIQHPKIPENSFE